MKYNIDKQNAWKKITTTVRSDRFNLGCLVGFVSCIAVEAFLWWLI